MVPTYNNVIILLFFILTGKIQSVVSFPIFLEKYFMEKPIIDVDDKQTKVKFINSEYIFSDEHAEAFYTASAQTTERPQYYFQYVETDQYISRNSDDEDVFVFMILQMLYERGEIIFPRSNQHLFCPIIEKLYNDLKKDKNIFIPPQKWNFVCNMIWSQTIQDINYSKPTILINFSKFILTNFLYDGENNTDLNILKFWFSTLLKSSPNNDLSLTYSDNKLALNEIFDLGSRINFGSRLLKDMTFDKINIINEKPLIISNNPLDSITYYKNLAYFISGLGFRFKTCTETIFSESLSVNLQHTYNNDINMDTQYIKNLIEPLIVLLMISPLNNSRTTRYLYTFFSLIPPDEINNYVSTALLTLANINKEFVTKSFKLEKIKSKADKDIALSQIQNINNEYAEKFNEKKFLFKMMVNLISLNKYESETRKYTHIVTLLDEIPEFILPNSEIFIDKNFIVFIKQNYPVTYNSLPLSLKDKFRIH